MSIASSRAQARQREGGATVQTDSDVKQGHRGDAASTRRATVIERSGDPERIRLATLRLKDSGRPQKILQVPHSYIPLAAFTMWSSGVSGTVKNLSGTKTVRVRKPADTRAQAAMHRG
jgi:hypothetical protein